MEQFLVSFLITLVALSTSHYYRWRQRQRQALETARLVEAERIIALLYATQPGVWDQEELRARVESTARDLWSFPRRDEADPLAQWVHPDLITRALSSWPARAERREVTVKLLEPVAFVQVQEGGEQDRLVARLRAQWEATWLDAAGRAIKRERRRLVRTYHAWVHIDGRGWQLTGISDEPPMQEPPPSSVACRIMPQAAPEEMERY